MTIHKAKTNLSKLVAAVEQGREVVVCRGQDPVAMIVPFRKSGTRRPKVGTITSKPVVARPGCFDAMTGEELAEWGLG